MIALPLVVSCPCGAFCSVSPVDTGHSPDFFQAGIAACPDCGAVHCLAIGDSATVHDVRARLLEHGPGSLANPPRLH